MQGEPVWLPPLVPDALWRIVEPLVPPEPPKPKGGRPIPLAEVLNATNVNEVRVLEQVLDAVPPVRGKEGRPRRRPDKLHADKAYGFRRAREALRARGVLARIARRGVHSSERLGRYRWVAERTFAWLNQMTRLIIRYERRADIHGALLSLGCSLICLRFRESTFR